MDKETLCNLATNLNFVGVFDFIDKLPNLPHEAVYTGLKLRFIEGERTFQFVNEVKVYISLLGIPKKQEQTPIKSEPTSLEMGLASYGLAELLKGEFEITAENAAKITEAWNRMREGIDKDLQQKIDPKTNTEIWFERILATGKLNKTDASDIRNLLKANALIYPYQCLIVSALMLSLMKKYDETRIDLLLDALGENVPHVWERALLALVMGLMGREQKVQANTALTRRLQDLQTKPTIQNALISISKAIYEMQTYKGSERHELTLKLSKFRQYGFFAENNKPHYWFLPFYEAPELLSFFDNQDININHTKLIDLLASPYLITLSDSNKYALCFFTATSNEVQNNHFFVLFEKEINENMNIVSGNYEIKQELQDRYFINLLADIWYFRNFYPEKDLADIFEKQHLLHETPLVDLLLNEQGKKTIIAEILFSKVFLLEDSKQEIVMYKQIVMLNPKKHKAWNNLGLAYANLQDYNQAINAFQKALEIKPDKEEAWNNLGVAYFNLGDNSQAINCYEKAIEIETNFHEAWHNLGIVYSYIKDYSQVIICYQKIVDNKADNYDVMAALGFAYFVQGEFLEAEKYFLKTMRIETSVMNLGHIRLLEQKTQEALVLYRQSLATFTDKNIFFIGMQDDFQHLQAHGVSKEQYEEIIAELQKL